MLRNGIYNVASAGIRAILTVITVPILIRLLGLDQYGLWVFISSTFNIIGLADIGLGVAAAVFVSRDLADADMVALAETLTIVIGAILIMATLAAVVLYFGAGAIASFFPDLPVEQRAAVSTAIQIGAFSIWFRLLQQILIGVKQAYQRYGIINLLVTLQAVTLNMGFIVLAARGGGIVELSLCMALVNGLILMAHIVATFALVRYAHLRLRWNWSRNGEIARYTANAWVASIGVTLFTQGDRLLIGRILGVEALGVYGAIVGIASQINTFSALIIQPILPSISGLLVDGLSSAKQVEEQVRRATVANAGVALSIGSLCLALGPTIMQFVLASTDPTYQHYFQIAIVIYTIYSLNAVGYFVLYGLGQAHKNTIVVLLSGALALALIALLSSLLGELGAFIGNAGYIATLALNVLMLREIGLSTILWLRWVRFPLFLFGLCVICTYFFPSNLLWIVFGVPPLIWVVPELRTELLALRSLQKSSDA
jgi:O-antigen/teichoic acid export membrane protein